MLKQILFVLLLLTACLNAAAQTVEEGTTAAGSSKLTAINLPNGALRVKDANIPGEIGEVLEKMIAQGGSRVRQGDREVLMWSGNYQKSKGAAMIERLANALRGAGWEYELAAKEADVTFFTVIREEPSRRALVGFFAPTDVAFVFALTEMLPNGGSNNARGIRRIVKQRVVARQTREHAE
jgi:hypothetical protein